MHGMGRRIGSLSIVSIVYGILGDNDENYIVRVPGEKDSLRIILRTRTPAGAMLVRAGAHLRLFVISPKFPEALRCLGIDMNSPKHSHMVGLLRVCRVPKRFPV